MACDQPAILERTFATNPPTRAAHHTAPHTNEQQNTRQDALLPETFPLQIADLGSRVAFAALA